jgi:hypothetical protein
MINKHRLIADDDAFDERGILKDGRTARVPVRLRDYAAGMSPVQGCKPGFRFATDSQSRQRRQAVNDAYAQSEAAMCSAWKNPPRGLGALRDANGNGNGVGSGGFRGQRENDICTVRGEDYPDDFGSPGVLRRRNGALVCVPLDRGDEEPLFDASQGGVDAREAAYRDHLRFLRDAYKNRG